MFIFKFGLAHPVSLFCFQMCYVILVWPKMDSWRHSSQKCQLCCNITTAHYSDVIMGTMASQITSLTIDYSTVYSSADQRKHQRSASLVFVRGIHRGPVNSPHKWPVTPKMFPFDDVIMAQNKNKSCKNKIKKQMVLTFRTLKTAIEFGYSIAMQRHQTRINHIRIWLCVTRFSNLIELFESVYKAYIAIK